VKITIVGAGAVGLVLGARLAASGTEIRFVTRRRLAAQTILDRGVRVEDPASGESLTAEAQAVCGLPNAEDWPNVDAVLLCTRATETADLAAELARVAPSARVISAQNGVDNERVLSDHFEHVGGMVVRQTCTRIEENAALAAGRGRLILGRFPSGSDDSLQALTETCRSAGYDVACSESIGEDKWLKLVVNLTSAPNALIRRADHVRPAFGILKRRLLEEARDVLNAAHIVARSCDGRDRSIEEEIESLRVSTLSGTGGRDLPLYNACWAALRDRSKGLEADLYHARILALAKQYGVAAPTHGVMLEALHRAQREGHGPESRSARDLLHLAESAP
jgi:2-dehydropantoate 2-reductase